MKMLQIFRPDDLIAAKEDMDALIAHQMPKRVPNGAMCFSGDFSVKNAGLDIAEVFHNPISIYNAICWTASQYQWNPFLQYSDLSVLGCLDFGGTMIYPTKNGEYLSALKHPVNNESDIENLTLPDPEKTGDISRQLHFARLQNKVGFPVGFASRSPFCLAANMSGMMLFMTWMIEKPSLCRQLMEFAYQHIIRTLDVWVANFGVENIQVWCSTPMESNQLISPRHMETFALPYLVKYCIHIKKLGIKQFCIHFCGEQNKNLPILAEADPWSHPAILSFGPEVDIVYAAKLFPQDIIYGNIDTILMEKGSPREVFDTCKELLEKGKRIENGFILAPGCSSPVFTPPVNMYAMTKAVEEHGIY